MEHPQGVKIDPFFFVRLFVIYFCLQPVGCNFEDMLMKLGTPSTKDCTTFSIISHITFHFGVWLHEYL